MADTDPGTQAPLEGKKVLRRYHLTYYRGLFGQTARRRCPHSDLVPVPAPGDETDPAGGRRLWCRGCRRHIDGPVRLAESREDETRVRPGETAR